MTRRMYALLMIAFAAICLLPSLSQAQQSLTRDHPLPAEKKTLIVYLSRTNNTKAIAEMIHQRVGGTLVALELDTPYPTDYRATVMQVVRENESGYLPPLKKDRPDGTIRLFISGLPDLGNATAAAR